ncbi:cupredoxin domain-containing protein [Phanerochaete sordida]|uniref:Cupredoxin domain-containing protein n=1 Tax=Phanerochaete sordida TaxID=48140 RepID=A0A9P3GHU8_9APHY|nr:cupredoxin domain-containing protein [Phanerochaete sordida]
MMKTVSAAIPLFALCGLAQAFTYTVTIGIDETNGQQGIGFDPSAIRPSPGDTITFTYALPEYLKNPPPVQHSATQSTFDNPCTAMSGGFDTGVHETGWVSSSTGDSFNLVVNDTQPLWFFSSVGDDCKQGMVLAVNPPLSGDQTADAFKQKAMLSTSTPSATAPSSSSSPASSQPPSGTSSAAPTMTSPPPPSQSTNSAASHMAKLELCLAAVVAFIGVTVMAQ